MEVTHLSKLIEGACAGEDVVIAKGGKPVARLVPSAAGGFRFGVLDGRGPAPALHLVSRNPRPRRAVSPATGNDGGPHGR